VPSTSPHKGALLSDPLDGLADALNSILGFAVLKGQQLNDFAAERAGVRTEAPLGYEI
jgi:hypothetical protein